VRRHARAPGRGLTRTGSTWFRTKQRHDQGAAQRRGGENRGHSGDARRLLCPPRKLPICPTQPPARPAMPGRLERRMRDASCSPATNRARRSSWRPPAAQGDGTNVVAAPPAFARTGGAAVVSDLARRADRACQHRLDQQRRADQLNRQRAARWVRQLGVTMARKDINQPGSLLANPGFRDHLPTNDNPQ
jgi:hypothetical protein